MKKLTTLTLLLFALFLGCRKDHYEKLPLEEVTSKIERDSLFIEWGKAASGRWITYSLEKVDKKEINKENMFRVFNSATKPVYNARKYYEELLFAKYGSEVTNFTSYLDSLHRKNYDKISYSLRMRSVMDKLYAKYGELALSGARTNMRASGKVSWGDPELDEVVISACGIPGDLLNFYNIYLRFPLFPVTPPGGNQGIVDCRTDALADVSSAMASLRNAYTSGWECALHRDEAYMAMAAYYNCDPINPYPGWSPFDPFSGGGGGGGSGSTDIVRLYDNQAPITDDEVYEDPDSSATYAEYNNQNPWPSKGNILSKDKFVPHRRDAQGRDVNCLTLAREQLAKAGYTCSGYMPGTQTFNTFTEPNTAHLATTKAAVTYLNQSVNNGIPVIVGVHAFAGSPNLNNTTDHFVVINGAGTDVIGKYYTFIDNATNNSNQGFSTNNKLYYDPSTGLIKGYTAVTQYTNGSYIVSEVRKSVPKP